MGRRKLNPEQIEEICALRERAWSYQRIATRFGVKACAIYYHCLKHGAEPPKGRTRTPRQPATRQGPAGQLQRTFTPAEDAQLLALSIAGTRRADICRIMGRAGSTVTMRLMALAAREEAA